MKRHNNPNHLKKHRPDPVYGRGRKEAINNPNPGPRTLKQYYQRTPDIILDNEIDLILDEAMRHGRRDYTLIFFALNTGLRNSEVIGLNVEDVCPYGTVVDTLELPARIAKGNKPRSIPLCLDVKYALEIYLSYEKAANSFISGSTALFRSKWSNKRLGRKDFHQILERHSIKAIKHRCHPHMLRHTFATKLIKQADIKLVQEILGHASLQSTQVYLHPSSSEKLDAVNKLNFGHNRKE